MNFFDWLFEILSGEKDGIFYYSGMKLMARGEFTKASFEFIEAIKINPTEEKYYDAYGKTLFKQGMRVEADRAFGIADDLKGIAKDPYNVKILCRLARGFQDKRMLSVSQKYIKKLLEINPNNDQVYFLMGRTYYLENKFQRAIELYETALELNPYCFDAYKGLRDVYGAQGKKAKQEEFEELAKCVKRVFKSSNDPAAHTALGDAFRKYYKNKLAEAEYNEALRMNDKDEKALLGNAILKFNQNDHFNAKKYLYDVIKLNKYNSEPHSYLALIYQLDSKFKKEAEWERSLAKQLKEVEKANDQAKAYIDLGDFLFSGKIVGDAEEAYLRALKINSNNPEIHVKLALLYSTDNKGQKAIDYCDEAIKMAPDKDVGYIGKGRVLMKMDDLDKAIACFQEALKYSMKNPDIHGFLAEAYKNKGLYKLADKEVRIMGSLQSVVEGAI